MSPARPAIRLLALSAVLLAPLAFAQVDAVDPDAVEVQQKKAVDAVDPDAVEVKKKPREDQITSDAPVVKTGQGGGAGTPSTGTVGKGKPGEKDKKAEPKPEPAKAAVPPILTPATSDADLQAAWDRWQKANASNDVKAEAAARGELLALKTRSGATALMPMAVGLLRAAQSHQAAGDATGAIDLAMAGVELAPSVPVSHLMEARVFFEVDPSSPGRVLEALQRGLFLALDDPRYVRPLIADLASTLLTALLVLTAAVVLVLFLRRARYFLHDFHYLFPKALARWQSGALAVLLLLTPVVFRMGVATCLIVLFAAVALYLSTLERAVAWVLIATLGAVPFLGEQAAGFTSFAGTPAERVYLLEQGAPGTEPLAAEVEALVKEGKASFTEMSALGSWQLRRGRLEAAIATLKDALLKRPNEPRASNNLAVAMLMRGDLDNPQSILEDAARAEPGQGVPLFNLARLFQRRVAVNGASAAGEVDRGNQALFEAKQRTPSLAQRKDPPADRLEANALLITQPVPSGDLLALARSPDAEDRVGSELTATVLGDVPAGLAPFYPLAIAGLFFALGFLAQSIGAARPCNKCGQAVSKRSDPDLPSGSQMCTQCVNVFAKRGVVPPSLKVRKQLEVSRFSTRVERTSYVLGAICSGMGHVFTGAVLKGTLYGFLFVFGVVAVAQRHGVLRAPYEGPPVALLLVPVGLMLAIVYLTSLRGLFKRAG